MNQKIIEEQLEYIEKVRAINKGKKLYYNILTMGCQLNENDSEKISGMATEMGYIYTDNLEQTNLYIINTCCVRENAEEGLHFVQPFLVIKLCYCADAAVSSG